MMKYLMWLVMFTAGVFGGPMVMKWWRERKMTPAQKANCPAAYKAATAAWQGIMGDNSEPFKC